MSANLEVFEPSTPGSTAVEGSGAESAPARFAADLDWVAERGVRVTRHDLAREPGAPAENPAVRAALAERGSGCLPLILVDGAIVSQGTYPTRWELARWTGLGSRLSPETFTALMVLLDETIAVRKKSRCC